MVDKVSELLDQVIFPDGWLLAAEVTAMGAAVIDVALDAPVLEGFMLLLSGDTRRAATAGEHPDEVEVVRSPLFLRGEIQNLHNIVEEFLRDEWLVLALVEVAAAFCRSY